MKADGLGPQVGSVSLPYLGVARELVRELAPELLIVKALEGPNDGSLNNQCNASWQFCRRFCLTESGTGRSLSHDGHRTPPAPVSNLLARTAFDVLQLRLAHFRFLALGLADHKGAATQVLRFKQFIFSQRNLLKNHVYWNSIVAAHVF